MKTIGILGGLGPEATIKLNQMIFECTLASKDQEHVPTITYNNTQIPDRTAHIVYGGESPLPELIKTAKSLEQIGASFILIPCNTAHYYYDLLQAELRIPILNMISETAKFIKNNYGDVKKVGLLATTGTVLSGIYFKEFEKQGIDIITPSFDDQENKVMSAIYGVEGIKAGFKETPASLLKEVSKKLISEGAELIIAGCTEISLALKQEEVSFVIIFPMRLLAEKAVYIAKAENLISLEQSKKITEGVDL